MKLSIYVTHRFAGCHHWPNAPEDSILRFKHRHLFYVKAHFLVTHTDRDVEFFVQLEAVRRACRAFEDKNTSASCEQMAIEIAKDTGAYKVEVSEDGENGAIVEFNVLSVQDLPDSVMEYPVTEVKTKPFEEVDDRSLASSGRHPAEHPWNTKRLTSICLGMEFEPLGERRFQTQTLFIPGSIKKHMIAQAMHVLEGKGATFKHIHYGVGGDYDLKSGALIYACDLAAACQVPITVEFFSDEIIDDGVVDFAFTKANKLEMIEDVLDSASKKTDVMLVENIEIPDDARMNYTIQHPQVRCLKVIDCTKAWTRYIDQDPEGADDFLLPFENPGYKQQYLNVRI